MNSRVDKKEWKTGYRIDNGIKFVIINKSKIKPDSRLCWTKKFMKLIICNSN